MDFATAVRTCLSKYVDFSGRARRSEYWWWALAATGVLVVAIILDAIIGTRALYYLTVLALLLPNLAVGARWLHDTGKSGWFLLLGLIPIVGAIILLVFFVAGQRS